ncbi:MAG: hypothetical protein U5L10_03075 [Candidatus Moranbacteria bacterium]|nr:hypothetical protein [Candidatus Moranbacteria bacterium]
MKKRKKWIIIVLLLLLILFLAWLVFSRPASAPSEQVSDQREVNKNEIEGNKDGISEDKNNSGELTPEDVLKSLETDDSMGENVELEIVSPEEKSFMPRQARLWRAEFSGIDSKDSFRVECQWKFYLNENNEEVLHQEKEISSSTSKESPKACGFTSTFIEKTGKLRVSLEAKIKNFSGEILEEYEAEREYVVQ